MTTARLKLIIPLQDAQTMELLLRAVVLCLQRAQTLAHRRSRTALALPLYRRHSRAALTMVFQLRAVTQLDPMTLLSRPQVQEAPGSFQGNRIRR